MKLKIIELFNIMGRQVWSKCLQNFIERIKLTTHIKSRIFCYVFEEEHMHAFTLA